MKKLLIRFLKMNRVISWLLVILSIIEITLGYSLTILNVENVMVTRLHSFVGGVFALTLFLHFFISVGFIRYDWKNSLGNIWKRKAGKFTLLRLAQRVSGWMLIFTAIFILLSGLNWLKIGLRWLPPSTYHVVFDILLSPLIIVHVAIGLRFALLRRRIKQKEDSKTPIFSQARRNTVITLAAMFISLIVSVYVDRFPRLADTINKITGILPPGQYEVGKLRVLHVGSVPRFNQESWTLEVTGLVKNPLTLTYSELRKTPREESVSDFHCVTGWTKFANKWEGIGFKTLTERVKPLPNAKYATFVCYGGYTTSLPLEDLLRDDVILAYRLDDEVLPLKHGGPLRLVVPHKYGYKSAKWVRTIQFTEQQELGYWEIRGYSNTADPFTSDRYDPYETSP